jgi:hypothetical protein
VLGKAVAQLEDTAAQAQNAVQAVATSMAGMLANLAGSRVGRPVKVKYEPALRFTAKGNVMAVGGRQPRTRSRRPARPPRRPIELPVAMRPRSRS